MLIVPLQAVANQAVTVNLGGQACQMNVYAKTIGKDVLLFLDLLVNNSAIVSGVICEDRNRLVRDSYLGFVGDLSFVDLQGTADPDFTQLNSRFMLMYLEASDLTTMGFAG